MISGTVSPLTEVPFLLTTSTVKSGLGPNFTPSALALLMPSCWRSRRMSFSNSGDQGQDAHHQLASPRGGIDRGVINDTESNSSLGELSDDAVEVRG